MGTCTDGNVCVKVATTDDLGVLSFYIAAARQSEPLGHYQYTYGCGNKEPGDPLDWDACTDGWQQSKAVSWLLTKTCYCAYDNCNGASTATATGLYCLQF